MHFLFLNAASWLYCGAVKIVLSARTEITTQYARERAAIAKIARRRISRTTRDQTVVHYRDTRSLLKSVEYTVSYPSTKKKRIQNEIDCREKKRKEIVESLNSDSTLGFGFEFT